MRELRIVLYKQGPPDNPGRFWWTRYHWREKPVRESTGEEDRAKAQQAADKRRAKLDANVPVVPRMDTIRFREIRDDLVTYYAATGKRKIREVLPRLKHLDECFGGWRVVEVTPAEITKYLKARQDAGAANATAGDILRHPRIQNLHKPSINGPRQTGTRQNPVAKFAIEWRSSSARL